MCLPFSSSLVGSCYKQILPQRTRRSLACKAGPCVVLSLSHVYLAMHHMLNHMYIVKLEDMFTRQRPPPVHPCSAIPANLAGLEVHRVTDLHRVTDTSPMMHRGRPAQGAKPWACLLPKQTASPLHGRITDICASMHRRWAYDSHSWSPAPAPLTPSQLGSLPQSAPRVPGNRGTPPCPPPPALRTRHTARGGRRGGW
jgi:hypothetical protein